MFMDLQSVLRLEETPLEGKFIHICEEEDQLGMFLLQKIDLYWIGGYFAKWL